MPGKIDFEYDERRNIVFTVDEWEIRTEEDVDEFFAECARYFDTIGRKFYMISLIDGLRVQAGVSDYYSRKARETFERYMLGFARWGSNSWARMTVRATSAKAKLLANICDTRKEAIELIEKMK
jgi:hypothetical protein